MKTLREQTVVVVGASSGIGLAVAQLAGAQGANVVMMSRTLEKLQAASKTVEGRPILCGVDMLDEAAITKAFGELGIIDHLVLTAVADENKRRSLIEKLSAEQMERSFDKLRGFFFSVRAAKPKMRERGSVTLTSGGSALKPPKQGMSLLAAVNAGVITFGHALALELAPIRVNTITPGVVDTPVWAAEDRARIKAWAESDDLPARRFGQPNDIADAALFLMCNPYVTGHNLVIDGGLAAK